MYPRPPPVARWWWSTRLVAMLIPFAVALAASPPLAAQELPEGFEQGIFEIRIADLPSASVPVLVSRDGKILVPVRPVLELTGAPFHLALDSGRVTVARPRGIGTALADLNQKLVVSDLRVPIAPGDAIVTSGDIHLSTGLLAALLEAEIVVDQAALAIVLSREVPFPAQERLSVQAKRELEVQRQRGRGGRPATAEKIPFRARTGGGVLEWGISSSFPDPLMIPSNAYARLGAALAGGMARVGATLVNETDTGLVLGELTGNYHRVFPEGRYVSQVQVGDFVTEGLRARSVRGVHLTNAPFVRDPLFGEAFFTPDLPAGWEYEVYQDGRLLGFSGGGTESSVSIPLQYGSTPVQVRLYGPAGERVESNLIYLVPVLQLPAGDWQYAAGTGICPRRAECSSFSYLDLRYGVTPRLTVLGGVDVLGDSVAIGPRPYGGASAVFGRSWTAQFQAMLGSFAQASVQNFGAGRFSGGGNAGLTLRESGGIPLTGGGGFPVADSPGALWYLDGSLRIRLGRGRRFARSVDVSGRLDGTSGEGLDRSRVSVATGLRGLLVETGYESTRSRDDGANEGQFLLRATAPIPRLGSRWTNTPVVSAAAGVASTGLRYWEGTISAQPAGAVVNATVRWHEDAAAPSFFLGSSIRLGFGRAQARAGVQNGRTQGGAAIDGAVAFGGGGAPATLPYGGLGQSGATGVVFHDLDGDGVFGAGDEPVADASVGVGGARIKTGTDGRFRTWSVMPYEVLQLRLDTTSLKDPSWVPLSTEIKLRPSPHMYERADFPLVQTRELMGAVVAGPDVPTAGGVTLEIRRAGGETVQRIVTFSSGEYYVGRLLPGEYELRVAASSLSALSARAAPEMVRISVPASGSEFLVEAPSIRLLRR